MPTAAPKIVGRYALYDAIARGGVASVHLGRLLGPVGFSRVVALKRLHAHLAGEPDFVAALVDEARLTVRIRHPNIVPTIDVVTSDDELFIVMDYVPGESLSRLVGAVSEQHAPIPPGIASAIITGVLHGLHAAHEARSNRGEPLAIVHRDVSPQNVIVGTDGLARVLDFGIAKAASRITSTRDGQVKGKVAYMAPEQLRGGSVSRKTDVYAVAVVLWEVLTGKRLFSGENEGMVLEQVLLGAVDAPSVIAPDAPAALDEIALRGLARDPAKRYETAHDMALAIERALPPALPSTVAEWVQRTAGPALQERAARVAEVERDSPPFDASPSAGSAASASSPRPSPRRAARTVGFAVALAVAGGLLALVVSGRRAAPRADAAGARPTPSPSASAQEAPSPEVVAARIGDAAAALPSAAATAVPPTPSSALRASPPPRTRRSQSAADCNPPFSRDASGRVVWKRQCL